MFRIRSAEGVQPLDGVDPGMPIDEFQVLIFSLTGIEPAQQRLKAGFPPKHLNLSQMSTVADLGLQRGDVITVEKGNPSDVTVAPSAPGPLFPVPQAPPPPPPPAPPAQPTSRPATVSVAPPHVADPSATRSSHPPSAAATAASTASAVGPAPRSGADPPPRKAPKTVIDPETFRGVPLSDSSGTVVRRVVPADNSCLFNSIGYTLHGHARNEARKLRDLVVQLLRQRRDEYSEAVLGKPVDEYERWILSDEHWGGGIELALLADHYQCEIVVMDTQTLRHDVFGEGRGYTQRIYLIYDGIHYDPLALSPGDDLPEELDITVFSPQDEGMFQKALSLAVQAHRAHKFVDTSNFTLRCLVCQKGLVGQKEAVVHAKETGHMNFAEY